MSDEEEKSINEQLLAAADGKLEEVKRLLADGADVDFGDKFGETALMNACRGGHNEIVHYLVNNAQADVNVYFPDKTGWTSLMFAAHFGHLDLVTYLVACEADPNLKNKKDQTVYDMEPCIDATKPEVAEAIEQGKVFIGNPPSILKAAEPDPAPTNGEDAHLAARVERYTKISAHATTNEALIQFRELYGRTCTDFHQEPVPSVLLMINQLITGDAPLDILSLHGKGQPEKLQDSQLFPLFEVLGHGFPNCPFTTVDLSWNMIRNSGAKAIAVYLTHTKTLTALDLSGNKCEKLGIEKLAQALYGQSTLRSLKLSDNPVGDVGMSKLAEALLGNTKLTEVDLGHTELGTVTLMKLASVIRADAQVLSLNINSPLLYSHEEETTIAISKAIGSNTTIQKLYMSRHRMQDHGANWLSEYLQINPSLELVDLTCNQLTETGVAALVKAIARRVVGCHIPLQGNPLKGREHDEIIDAIEEADNENTPMKVTFVSVFEEHYLTAEPRRR